MKKHFVLESLGIIFAFLIVCILYWAFSDSWGVWALTGNPILVTGWNIITNPFYIATFILIFISLFKIFNLNKKFWDILRVSIASILISLAFDILTILHSIPKNYDLSQITAQTSIYFDTILGKILYPILPHSAFGTFILYVIIPTLMILIALLIVNPKIFIMLFQGEIGINKKN